MYKKCILPPTQSTREFTETMQCVQEGTPASVSQLKQKYGGKIKEYKPVSSSIPDSLDWRTAGAVAMVKDQVWLTSLTF